MALLHKYFLALKEIIEKEDIRMAAWGHEEIMKESAPRTNRAINSVKNPIMEYESPAKEENLKKHLDVLQE